MDIPATIKILMVFGGILLAHRLRLPLGFSLILGSIGLACWADKAPAEVMRDLGAALSQPELWLLLLIVALIFEFGRFMARSHNADTLRIAVQRWGGRHGRAFSLMAIPAVIGLVPMPGGALFSAPLVGETAKETHWTPAWKTVVNYWFRHTLEYWWPLYPVVILTLSIFDIETWTFMAVQFPFTFISFLAGYLFLLRPHRKALSVETTPPETPQRHVFFIFLPIMVILISTVVLPLALRPLFPEANVHVPKLLAMLVGIGIGLILIARDRRHPLERHPFRGLFSRKALSILMTLAGVMVFKSILQSSGLLPQAGRDLIESGIPLPMVIALLPLIAGLVTGIALGFAGTAFPLLAGLLQSDPKLNPLATLVLAFGFGYIGMLCSPVHLCFILTRNYFSAPYRKLYKEMAPCLLMLGITAIGLYILLNAFHG